MGSDKPIPQTTPVAEIDGNEEKNALSGVGDALHAAAYAGLQQPAEGIVQLVNEISPIDLAKPNLVSAPTDHSAWTTAGSMAGHVADFFVLSKFVRGASRSMLGRAETIPILETATTGAIFELFMPVAGDQNVLGAKFRNAAVGFGTFGTMDGASIGLRNLKYFQNANTLVKRSALGGLSGGAGGVSHSLLDAGVNGHELNFYNMGSDVVSYAAFGSMFGALDHGVNRAHQAAKIRIQQRIDHGEPIFSVGPIEVHPRGFGSRTQERVHTDGLTGLKNKAGGDEVLANEVSRAHREQDQLSLTYLDLDNFKTVNDKIGHAHGDGVLREVAKFIRNHFRRGTDIPVRDGGDEFLVVMPNTPRENAARVAESLEAELRIAVAKKPTTPEQIAANYGQQVHKVTELPRTASAQRGTTHEQLAEQLIKDRMHVTGELVTPENIAAEALRLRQRSGIQQGEFQSDKTFEAYTQQDLVMLAEKASFRFLPPIGQLLKNRKVATEEQIQEALDFQKLLPKDRPPLLGEILVAKGYSTREQVDQAFREQLHLRESLRTMREEILGAFSMRPPIATDMLPLQTRSSAEIQAFRDGIPIVYRPNLDPNGIRQLRLFEQPVEGEIVVGASTGVVQLLPNESPAGFKHRGDELMFDKKRIRKEQGLRVDRKEQPPAEPEVPARMHIPPGIN